MTHNDINRKDSGKVQNAIKSSAWGLFFTNFFIWFVPGLVVLAFIVVILIILVIAADGPPGDGKILKKAPNGLLSFLGTGLILIGLSAAVLPIIYDTETEELITLIFFSFVSLLLGFYVSRFELRRLSRI